MENEALVPQEPLSPAASRAPTGLPPASAALPPAANATSADRERTGVFTSLVKEDSDISGLVAYSIYKQNKLDWLQAFEAAKGRAPDEAELAAYIIGESTPRRLATYRHLAESTLAGNGPDVGATARSPSARAVPATGMLTPNMLVVYAIIAVLFVVGFWLGQQRLDPNVQIPSRLSCSLTRVGGTNRSVRRLARVLAKPFFAIAISKRRPIIQA